jgi:ribonuclease BN (tRNA processing enzyme)
VARAADLFVCEATLEQGEDEGDERGHLSADEAITAAGRAGAKRLVLTHRPQERSRPRGFELAYDGFAAEI